MQALFAYISGKNDEGIKIPMTVPVLTSYIPNEDHPGPSKPEEEKNFTVSFYLQPKIAVSQADTLDRQQKVHALMVASLDETMTACTALTSNVCREYEVS